MDWREKARSFALEHIIPHYQHIIDNVPYKLELYDKMAKEGFFSLSITDGVEVNDYLMALREIARTDAGIAVTMAVTNMVAELIQKRGSEEQKSGILSRIQNGMLFPLSFALTEPQAGSDVHAIETTFEKEGDHFIVNGSKQFITNADLSPAMIVIGRIKHAEHHGITALLIEKPKEGLKGFEVTKKEVKLGLLAAHLIDIRFSECRVPASSLFGQIGEGLKIAFQALDSGRLGIAAQALGIADAAYESALQYSKQRYQFDMPICNHQAIAFKLADMRVDRDAGEALLLKAGVKKQINEPYTLEASSAKLFCSEMSIRLANACLEIHGGYGYVEGYSIAERLFRDSRVTTIYEGTSEIQKIVISRSIINS